MPAIRSIFRGGLRHAPAPAWLGWMLVLLVGATPAWASPSPARPGDRAIASFVDRYVADAVRARNIPGAAVVVVRDGRTILARGYGVANHDTRRPISIEDGILRQGSTGKLLVWLLAMQLVEEGRLDLDRDVNSYLDFRIPDAFGAPITMRHLMTHSAGFGDRLPLIRPGTGGSPLAFLVRDNVPERVYAPGSVVAYSNYGAALAAHVVERLRGQPFERLVEERLFAPLGMARSTVAQPVPPRLQPLLVSNYSASARLPHDFEFVGLVPAGSLSASAGDMGRLLQSLMRGGHPILREETMRQMLQLQRRLGPGLASGLGYGFIVGEYRGIRYAGHGGTMAASVSDLEILPEQALGWYIGFNGRGGNGSAVPLRQDLLRAVIDRFYAPADRQVEARGPSTAADVAGRYRPARRIHEGIMTLFGALNPLVVSARDDGSLSIDQEGATTHWLPNGRDRFVEVGSGIALAVSRGPDGKVSRIASPFLNNVTEFERAPVSLALTVPVLLIAPPILVLAALAGPAAWIVRRFRRGAGRARERSRIERAARLSLWLIVFVMLGWIAYFVAAIVDPGLSGGPALVALNLASLLSLAAAAIVVGGAIASWRAPGRPLWRRAAGSIVAVAAVAIVWLYATYDFLNVSIA